MNYLKDHLISINTTIKDALKILDNQGLIANVLFAIDDNNNLRGSLTDGDIRRGLIKGINISDSVEKIINKQCKYIRDSFIENEIISTYRKSNIFFIPVVDNDMKVVSILDLRELKNIIPVDALIMAGGKGKRLLPLTLNTPKPLLKIGDKPVIEYNIDRIKSFGVKNIFISINYLGEQLIEYFGDGASKNIAIKFIKEERPLGTIGAIKLIESALSHDTILIMNSDLLTTIDLNGFYNEFISADADMAVASTIYNVDIPYAVMEINNNNVVSSLKEKPKYTYYSNAGIYLIKKEVLKHIPNDFFDSTDLMECLINEGKKIVTFPILGYWLDIGNFDDYKKAQEDIKHINISL